VQERQLVTLVKAAFEYRHPVDGYIKISVEDGLVIAVCHWPFDRETDEWINIKNSYPIIGYRRAVEDAENGTEGVVAGVRCGHLKVVPRIDGFMLELSNPEKGWLAKSLQLSVSRPLQDLVLEQ